MRLRTSKVEVLVRPDVGGKIEQIFLGDSRIPLLIAGRRPLRTLPFGSRWVDFDTSGFDDCFPNVEEGHYPDAPWKGAPLPQLGEWVYGAWDVREASADTILLQRNGQSFPYLACKRIALLGDLTFRVSYEIENCAKEPLRYLWSAHPLFAVGEHFRIELQGSRGELRSFPDDGKRACWPNWRGVDLSSEWIPRGTTVKVFVAGGTFESCTLYTDRWTARIRADWQTTPVLGLWYNNFGFPQGDDSFRAIAVEPTTAPCDTLEGCEPPWARRIQGGESVQWWMEIEFEH